jgi:hypothetical protein
MTDENAVRALLRSITAARDANDADAFAAHYAQGATVVLPGEVFHRDREEIRAWMAAGFDGPLKGTHGVDEPELIRARGRHRGGGQPDRLPLPGRDGPARGPGTAGHADRGPRASGLGRLAGGRLRRCCNGELTAFASPVSQSSVTARASTALAVT